MISGKRQKRLCLWQFSSYLLQEVVEEDRILGNVIELVRLADIEEDVPGFVSPLDVLFNELEEKDPTNFACSAI